MYGRRLNSRGSCHEKIPDLNALQIAKHYFECFHRTVVPFECHSEMMKRRTRFAQKWLKARHPLNSASNRRVDQQSSGKNL